MDTLSRQTFRNMYGYQADVFFIPYLLKLARYHFQKGLTLRDYSDLDWGFTDVMFYESEILKMKAELEYEIFNSTQLESNSHNLPTPGRGDAVTPVIRKLLKTYPNENNSALWVRFTEMARGQEEPIFSGFFTEDGRVIFDGDADIRPMSKSSFSDRVDRAKGLKKGR